MGIIRYAANGTTPLDGDSHGSEYVHLRNSNGDSIGDDALPIATFEGLAPHPGVGGFYSVTGQSGTAPIAASLAANTTLMSMRFDPTSTRKAYIKRAQMQLQIVTVGSSGLVPGSIGLQRLNAATPTLGTARTVAEFDEVLSTPSEMVDVRDHNAALTVTSVVFGKVISQCFVPIDNTYATSWYLWEIDLIHPIVLQPGDGLCLRTQTAMPGTQSWMFTYNFAWEEK